MVLERTTIVFFKSLSKGIVADRMNGAGMPDAVITAAGVDGLRALVGVRLGPTSWFDVEQSLVDAFARATGDDQWIHVDPVRAKRGPYGGTIAHGFLTLALLPRFWRERVRVEGFRAAINYGLNRVRFPAPVPVPSRVRARLHVEEVHDAGDGVQVLLHAEFERDGEMKPVCIADAVFRYQR